MYTIQCEEFNSFMDTIAELVKRGLHFHADQENYKIMLTGGF